MSVEFYMESPGEFDSRTLSRKTLSRWTGRIFLRFPAGTSSDILFVLYGFRPGVSFFVYGFRRRREHYFLWFPYFVVFFYGFRAATATPVSN